MAADSSIYPGRFDPFNTQLNVDDLRRTQLKIEGDLTNLDDRIVQIVYKKLPTPIYESSSLGTWFSSVVTGTISIATGDTDPTSLYNIKRAFDAIVKREIKEENEVNLERLPIDIRCSIVTESIKKLTNLQNVLINHNAVIKDYNARFFISNGCSDHSENLDAIGKQIEKMKIVKTSLLDNLARLADKKIENLQNDINNGMKIDKQYLVNQFPFFMSFISTIEPLLKQKEIRESYQMIINQAYIANLISQIKDQAIDIPASIYELLSEFGLPKEFIQIQLATLSTRFITTLERLIGQDNFGELSPLTIKEMMESHLIDAAKDLVNIPLTTEQRERVSTILKKLHEFETKYTSNYQNQLRSTKENLLAKFRLEKTHPVIRQQVINDIQAYNSPYNSGLVLHEILKGKRTGRVMTESKESFEALIQDLDKSISAEENRQALTMQTMIDKTLEPLLKIIDSSKEDWSKRNEKHQVFAFNQAAWGDEYVLDKGVCVALNYRWIKELLKDPNKVIRSQSDLDPNNTPLKLQEKVFKKIKSDKIDSNPIVAAAKRREKERELSLGISDDAFIDGPRSSSVTSASTSEELSRVDSKADITIKDRMRQATYALATHLSETNAAGMPEAILKRDKMESSILTSKLDSIPSTITELIDKLMEANKKENFLTKSDGIIGVGIYKATKNTSGAVTHVEHGHAIGMQIDSSRNIYRFWDVNYGFYSYSSLDELKKQSSAYIREVYFREGYNYFNAIQYFPKTSS